MKIIDLNKGDYVIVHDIGKSDKSAGMTIVGQVVELKSPFDKDIEIASIKSATNRVYEITDENEFERWNDYMANITERVSDE